MIHEIQITTRFIDDLHWPGLRTRMPIVHQPFPSFHAKRKNRYNEWRCLEKSQSPLWDQAIDTLAAEIKTRHYSRKTLKTYADWVRKFQHYLRDKPLNELSSVDVKNYLTY